MRQRTRAAFFRAACASNAKRCQRRLVAMRVESPHHQGAFGEGGVHGSQSCSPGLIRPLRNRGFISKTICGDVRDGESCGVPLQVPHSTQRNLNHRPCLLALHFRRARSQSWCTANPSQRSVTPMGPHLPCTGTRSGSQRSANRSNDECCLRNVGTTSGPPHLDNSHPNYRT